MRIKSLGTAALLLSLLACQKGEVTVKTAAGTAVRLQVVSPEIVRVSVTPDGKFRDRESLMVLPQKEARSMR